MRLLEKLRGNGRSVAVGAEAAPGGVAEAAFAVGELAVDDFADEHRPDPVRAEGVLARDRVGERAVRLFQPFEFPLQFLPCPVGESCSHVTDVGQVSGLGMVGAEEESAERSGDPALAGPPAADDDFLGLDRKSVV